MTSWRNISVVMITHNAASTITKALQSIPPDTEIIVADAESEDQTVSIARSLGARVIQQDLDKVCAAKGNFDVARNQAMALAKNDWIVILDSDERLPHTLIEEIAEAAHNPREYVAFDLPRRNLFWGKEVRLLGEDRQIRLIRRGKGNYCGFSLHAQISVDGHVGHLKEALIHYNITSLIDIKRMFRRLPVERQGTPPEPNILKILQHILRMSKYYLVHQQAWKDGGRGIVISCLYALYHGLSLWPGKSK